jgi:hypothetical protein
MPSTTEPAELVSIDDTIDATARVALEEARRVEEASKYRQNPGPVIAPAPPLIAPKQA